MHPLLLKLPNVLFYSNRIENEYRKEIKNKFIDVEKPLFFLNCETKSSNLGESIYNKGEVEAIK